MLGFLDSTNHKRFPPKKVDTPKRRVLISALLAPGALVDKATLWIG